MRMAFGLFCEKVEDKNPWGYNLYGVKHGLTFEGKWTRGPVGNLPPIPIEGVLFISLLDGTLGKHRVMVAPWRNDQQQADAPPPVNFEWAGENTHQYLLIHISFKVEAISGLFEFRLLVDGEPLGIVPLMITIVETRDS